MDTIEQLKPDVRQGRIDVERLIDVIVSQQRQLEAARQRIEELEKKLAGPPTADTAKVDRPSPCGPRTNGNAIAASRTS